MPVRCQEDSRHGSSGFKVFELAPLTIFEDNDAPVSLDSSFSSRPMRAFNAFSSELRRDKEIGLF
jgi:hypothetical protein